MSQLADYFKAKDNAPPPRVRKMVVRQRLVRTMGPFRLVAETSCSHDKPHLAGSMKLSLYDVRDSDDEPVVRRQQVDNWREFQGEVRAVEGMLLESMTRV